MKQISLILALLFVFSHTSCSPALLVSASVAASQPVMLAGIQQKKARKKRRAQLPVPLGEEQQRRYNYYYYESARLNQLKDFAAAYDLLQHCLAIHPNAPSALYELSLYYLSMKQTAKSCELMEQAVAAEPDNYWYGQGLFNLYMQQDEVDKAIRLLEDMSRRFPDKPEVLYSLFSVYARNNNYDKQIDVLNRLEEKLGVNEQLSMQKYAVYLQQKDDEKAMREINALVSKYPHEPRYRVMLGDEYLKQGDAQKAYDIYREVLAQEPENSMALYSMASYYEQTGQTELYEQQLDTILLNKDVETETKLEVMRRVIVESDQTDSLKVVRLFDRIMAQEPDDPDLPMLYVQYLMAKGKNKEALPVVRKVLDIDPTNTAARMMLLGDAVNRSDYNEVISLCESGVEADPEKLEFYYYLALGYSQAERRDDELRICQEAVKHVNDQSPKELVSDLYAIMGDTYHGKDMVDEAFAAYDSCLVYNPNNIMALNNYAYYLSLRKKDLDRAEEMSFKTVKAEPNNGTYLDTYAWILFMKGNYAQARIYIDMAMKGEEQKSADVVEHCGDIYFKNGEVEKALDYWKKARELGADSDKLKQKIAQKKYIE